MCRAGWYYLLVVMLTFGAAMAREVNLLLILAGMLVGPLLLSRGLAGLTLHGITVRRKVPQNVCAGDLLVSHIILSNTRRSMGSWAVMAEDVIQRESGKGDEAADALGGKRPLAATRPERSVAGVLFPYLPARQSRKGVYRGRFAERGRYRLGPLRISTRFPFGLFCRTITLEHAETLTVFPRLGRLNRGWLARRHESFADADRRERRPGSEGDFYGIRPWRAGDSLRWIHWRSSARTGKLLVRQFEQPRNRDLAILLDLWQPVEPTARQRENVELAVSFVATAVADLCRKGDTSLYLGTNHPRPEFFGGATSTAMLSEVMQRLAVIEARNDDGLSGLLEEMLRNLQPDAEVLIVSTRPVCLDDAERFGRFWTNQAWRALLRRTRVIDTSSDELTEYFQVEQP
jgi:uncharacterized protein (DUF58 family)